MTKRKRKRGAWAPKYFYVSSPTQNQALVALLREAVRARHYSPRTEEVYVMWNRRFILFHGKEHPSAMGAQEVNAFLTHLI